MTITRILARRSSLRTVRPLRALSIDAVPEDRTVVLTLEHGRQTSAESTDWHRSAFVELGPQSARVLGQRLIEAARVVEGIKGGQP